VQLNKISKMSSVELALYGLKIKISKSNIDPAASSILKTVWVKVHGVPSFARDKEIINEITSLVAEPIKVDDFSLLRDEPIRVRVNCRDPSKLKGFVEIFFNGVGYEIRFAVEGFHGGPKIPTDRTTSHGKTDDSQRGGGKTKDGPGGGQRKTSGGDDFANGDQDVDLDASQGDSQYDNMEYLVRDGSPDCSDAPHFVTSIAMAPPLIMLNNESGDKIGKPLDEGGYSGAQDMDHLEKGLGADSVIGLIDKVANQVLNTQEEVFDSQESLVISQEKEQQLSLPAALTKDQIKVHNEEGVYFMEADKWPNLSEVESGQGDQTLTQEEAISDLWESPPAKKKKIKAAKPKVVIATRTSSRIPRDGIPIADKAMKRVQEKNNLHSGTSKNPFTILNNTSDVVLEKIISDLDITSENMNSVISAFKVEELARADLAQANYNKYLDRINSRTAPQGEEVQDLTMNVINNDHRLLEIVNSPSREEGSTAIINI